MSVPKPVYASGVWIVRTYLGTIETNETERFRKTRGQGVGRLTVADQEAGEAAVWGWG